jgi:hypothetical protein
MGVREQERLHDEVREREEQKVFVKYDLFLKN